MKLLPLGRQSFEGLRTDGCLYVDKTEIIHKIISDGKVYFLSRPRRFGKSLLVSTMESIFKGKKELFEGLYIYDKWDWSQHYPVIKIDWTCIAHSTPEVTEESLCNYFHSIAMMYDITLVGKTPQDCFLEMIMLLHKQSGQKVIVLIDEYDKPITSHLFDSNLDAMRKVTHDLYQVMKGADDYLKFIFITGVSKFYGLSVFSALNNIKDITLDGRYATVCGYTQEELEDNFPEYIDEAAKYLNMTREKTLEGIRYWYNGYTWDGKTSVYNPFLTVNFFDDKLFNDYWYNTGTPSFLIDILQRRNKTDIVLKPFVVGSILSIGYDPSTLDEVPLLFQTGYLTIKRKKVIKGHPFYTLDLPNKEVKNAFLKSLLRAYGQFSSVEDVDELRRLMERQINNMDVEGLNRSLEAMIATVPYKLHRTDEAFYHTMMLVWMRLLGFRIQGETPNNRGSVDAVWKQRNVTVIAEVKFHAKKEIDVLLDEAIAQIHERRYYNKFLGKIILLGVAFSGKNVGCRIEELQSTGE